MELIYRAEFQGRFLLVSIEERGSKRILYLDALKSLAKEVDKEALKFLVKLQMCTARDPETVTFQRIEVPRRFADEALRLMEKTGRLIRKEVAQVAAVSEAEPKAPILSLTDFTGSFANLNHVKWEGDLLAAGYVRKTVGRSDYYCPTDKVKEALELLLAVGWQVEDAKGGAVHLSDTTVREEKGRIAIRGPIRGLLDPKLQMEGVWEGDTLYVKKSRISALQWLSKEEVRWDEKILELSKAVNLQDPLPASPPGELFRGELLPYQQKGVDWLCFLYKWGFSGLLADEMGLGKTVQVLAFLSRLGTNLPVLIVAPTSLLFNWRAEMKRFLPHHGAIEIISYTTLRLNESYYSQMAYEAIILDESNAIKTAATQTAQAACKLQGKFKVCLSGTPMENRPDELWSQFHFLMPDLLERNALAETVRRQVRPFLLRRKKEQVEIDLPEKVEQITWVEMHPEQQALYEAHQKGFRLEGAGSMQILEAILRLRQIACDPRLVGSDLVGAKIEQLKIDVSEAMEEGRKILVFSQFTSFLQLIRDAFPKALYLDGTLSVEARAEQVLRFQQDPNASLFLLSMKAAGVGLNLTAADYVLLLDPWWNEAVERQAIDRAHRIGQKKTVIVKRYLTPGSVEEKMLQLKAEKLKAADELLDSAIDEWTCVQWLQLLS